MFLSVHPAHLDFHKTNLISAAVHFNVMPLLGRGSSETRSLTRPKILISRPTIGCDRERSACRCKQSVRVKEKAC